MSELPLPRGVLTPMITPFHKDAVDEPALQALIKYQRAAGVHGVIVCDQTGEGLTLSEVERASVLANAVEAAADRISVVAAVFSSCTSATVDMIAAVPDGVSALLVTVPFYSRPTLGGIVHHFQQIAEATRLPVIIDDDPKRTAKALTPEMLGELKHSENIRGVRHCSGDVTGFFSMPSAIKRRFRHYAGDDRTALAYLMAGASSVSSPIANLFPSLVCSFYDLARIHTVCGGNAVHERLSHTIAALGSLEPPALKHALSLLGGCQRDVRLPLLSLDNDEGSSLASVVDYLINQESRISGYRQKSSKNPMRF